MREPCTLQQMGKKNGMDREKWSAVHMKSGLAGGAWLSKRILYVLLSASKNTGKVTFHFPMPGILPQLLPALPAWLLALGSDPSAPPQKTMLRTTGNSKWLLRISKLHYQYTVTVRSKIWWALGSGSARSSWASWKWPVVKHAQGRNGVYLMEIILWMLTFVHNSMDIQYMILLYNYVHLRLYGNYMEPVCRPTLCTLSALGHIRPVHTCPRHHRNSHHPMEP